MLTSSAPAPSCAYSEAVLDTKCSIYKYSCARARGGGLLSSFSHDSLFTQTCKKLPHHPGTWKGSSNGKPVWESLRGVQGHLWCRGRGSGVPYPLGAASLTSSELSLSAGALKTKAWPGLRRAPPRRGSTTGEESVPRKGLQSAHRTACMSAAGPRALPASACGAHGTRSAPGRQAGTGPF